MANLKKKKGAVPEAESRFLNRELSWLEFNRRVLAEAKDVANPLLERAKFLAIFESNLDEFYMVRVSGLVEQFESGLLEISPDGLSPEQQLIGINRLALKLRLDAAEAWENIRGELGASGVRLLGPCQLSANQRSALDDAFLNEVFQVCTPLILHPAPSFPFISNRSLNLAVELEDPHGGTKLARVKIPDVLPRFLRVGKRFDFVGLEDVIREHLPTLFPGVAILGSYLFRVIRDADVEIRELEADDLIESIEETIRRRRFGDPVLLQVSEDMPASVLHILLEHLELTEADCFKLPGMLGLDGLHQLAALDRPALRDKPHHPHLSEPLAESDSIFAEITRGDVLIHHPFDSFRTVERYIAAAAQDPHVLGIKQTMYRVGVHSPVVESLLEAAEEGKQVAAMVELKARFDEDNNLTWARALERAGVHVTYGFAHLKTHCKLCLIVRREGGQLRSYAHVGTGNYNPATARVYTDLGFFTADPEITQDVAELFNYLTGFSLQREYRRLLVAPINMREGVLQRIAREAKHKNGRIIFKLNSLVDPEMIDALYAAADAGVTIDLIIRGICCLKPRPGIRVVSIIGRFLEHSRVLYFRNGGKEEVLIGSADLMRRNLDRRVEVLVPLADPKIVRYVRDVLLETYLKDTVNAWDLRADGSYRKREPGAKPFDSHTWFMTHPMAR